MDEHAAKLVRSLVLEFEVLDKTSVGVFEYRAWSDRVDHHQHARDIPWVEGAHDAHKFLSGFIGQTDLVGFRDARRAAMKIYSGLRKLLPPADDREDISSEKGKPFVSERKVFIAHGHDERAKWELKSFLGKLRLDPIILHEQDDRGMTIIEKFEYYASECSLHLCC